MTTTDYINKITCGDCLELMKHLDDNSVDCCITSPPYWGLRDYGTAKWEGGSVECDHKLNDSRVGKSAMVGNTQSGEQGGMSHISLSDVCPKCGAKRIDSQLGLEKTPEEYVAKLVAVFQEVRRVLKPEGTLWLNLGDSYVGSTCYGSQPKDTKGAELARKQRNIPMFCNSCGKHFVGISSQRFCSDHCGGKDNTPRSIKYGYKPKDLVGIPWRVAFALQAAGWWLRQDIIWAKPNPMPESVTDRCTKSHEYIFLLAKSQKYYYDSEAIKEKGVMDSSGSTQRDTRDTHILGGGNSGINEAKKRMKEELAKNGYVMRNKRSVWSVTTKPFKDAHFATFPEDLIEPMVKAGCPKDGIILDPFIGSGTTGLVAVKLQRRFIGFELNEGYCEMARERIRPYMEQQRLI